jgi:hypothetical protein
VKKGAIRRFNEHFTGRENRCILKLWTLTSSFAGQLSNKGRIRQRLVAPGLFLEKEASQRPEKQRLSVLFGQPHLMKNLGAKPRGIFVG